MPSAGDSSPSPSRPQVATPQHRTFGIYGAGVLVAECERHRGGAQRKVVQGRRVEVAVDLGVAATEQVGRVAQHTERTASPAADATFGCHDAGPFAGGMHSGDVDPDQARDGQRVVGGGRASAEPIADAVSDRKRPVGDAELPVAVVAPTPDRGDSGRVWAFE